MNSNEKAFLERFCVKQSSNLIDLEDVGAAGFSIEIATPPITRKGTKSPPIRVPRIPNF